MVSPTTPDWGSSDMPSLADLIRMGKQYIGDAMPGGALNQEVTGQSVLDGVATALTPVPLVGDVAGLAADAYRYKTDPESRTPLNYGLSALGALPFIPSMTAWHGSPHKFDKFSLDKIGTGEGAQAYGHGLYLAESPEVANQYRINLAYDPEKMRVGGKQINAVYDSLNQQAAKLPPKQAEPIYEQMDLLERLMANETYETVADYARSMSPTTRKWLSDTVKPTFETYGHTYKTDIPDEAVARFLDWDKPLSQQAPVVQRFFNGQQPLHDPWEDSMSLITGTPHPIPEKSVLDYYNKKIYDLGGPGVGDKIISNEMLNAGIPGIRYLDGGSRSAGQGSSNFVAFDPEMIRILERNGQATGLEPWKPGEYRLKDLIGKE